MSYGFDVCPKRIPVSRFPRWLGKGSAAFFIYVQVQVHFLCSVQDSYMLIFGSISQGRLGSLPKFAFCVEKVPQLIIDQTKLSCSLNIFFALKSWVSSGTAIPQSISNWSWCHQLKGNLDTHFWTLVVAVGSGGLVPQSPPSMVLLKIDHALQQVPPHPTFTLPPELAKIMQGIPH